MKDFDTSNLSGESLKIAQVVVKVMKDSLSSKPTGGGCKAFYTPQEWEDRNEQYGQSSKLILVHDGGDLKYFCDADSAYETKWVYSEKLRLALKEIGYYVEQCTSWYSAVYEV